MSDRRRVLDLFDVKIYSVESLSEDCDINLYLKLKSKQRAWRRINSKISKINRYYNSKTELFARFFEYYITDYSVLERKAPNALKRFEKVVGLKQIPLINEFKSRCF